VTAGDNLGISFGNYYANGEFIASSDLSPYYYLEYNLTTGRDSSQIGAMVLLEQGAGQNSARVLDRKTSPVIPRAQRGMKVLCYSPMSGGRGTLLRDVFLSDLSGYL
jgi:hypothetical protein